MDEPISLSALHTSPSPEDDYEFVIEPYDMTVHLIKGGVKLAILTVEELGAAKERYDTPEMNFARALAIKRAGMLVLPHV